MRRRWLRDRYCRGDRWVPGSENRPLFFYRPDVEGDEAWAEARRPDLPLRNKKGEVVDKTQWAEEFAAEKSEFWSKSITASACGALPAYRLPPELRPSESIMKEVRAAIPPEEWFRKFCHDARDLVIEAEIHVCNPSCWKYHSQGANHICRHGSYHVVTLVDEDMNEVTRRRRGKALRGCIAIVRDTRFGMAGRILTYQMHPGESPTNYAALCTMRCNVDVQDLRRVLPPILWLEPHELEPEADANAGRTHTHGAYPQRLRQYNAPNVGANWGWMQHLGTSPCGLDAIEPEEDWLGVFQSLTGIPRADAEEFQELAKPLAQAVVASFVDAHNTGYYINSYTTKVNPNMDNVLRRLFDGVRRLHDDWNQDSQRDGANEKKSKKRAHMQRPCSC